MHLNLDTSDDAPLHDRIAAAVRGAIADGGVAVGERLPGARDLAASLDVNVNTVLRAYRSLRDEGLLELRRGRGATVLAGSPGRAGLIATADDFIAEARRLGLTSAQTAAVLKERW